MSDDTPETLPVLRREALLPNERSRGLGTVAVVCTMAGVASGLALATTLMAMQVADTMSTRTCGYVATSSDHGFLGIRYVFTSGAARVHSVIPGTPAEAIGLQRGDIVLTVNGERMDAQTELQETIYGSRPGARPTITIRRNGEDREVRPTLAAWPAMSYAAY